MKTSPTVFDDSLEKKYNESIHLPKKKMTISFGGGCLILTCNECGKDIGAEEVNFPGTPEHQKEPRRKLLEKEKNHICQRLN